MIEDYKQYKKLRAEQERAKDKMATQLAKKCTLTSRPYVSSEVFLILGNKSEDQLAREQEQGKGH